MASENQSIIHNGDNKDGIGEGEAESIVVDFGKISHRVTALVFAVAAYKVSLKKITNIQLNISNQVRSSP